MTEAFSYFAASLMAGIESGAAKHEQWFNERAIALFRLQFEHNAAYRKYCDSVRVPPRSISNWMQIPSVPTSAFKEFDFTSIPPGERTALFHSSGTTQERCSRHFHDRESLSLYERALLLPFKRHLMPDRQKMRLISLTPSKAAAPNSSLVHMFDTVIKNFGDEASGFAGTVDSAGAWEVDTGNVVTLLMQATDAICILGTAFSFVFLADEIAGGKSKVKLPSGSRVLETGGYKGRSRTLKKAELHSLIANALQVDPNAIICEYSMCELSSQAYDGICGQQEHRAFHFPEWARAVVVSPETGREVAEGESGLIRVFDLANVASVVAIQTEDIGIRRNKGFELLGRATRAEARGCSLMSVQAK